MTFGAIYVIIIIEMKRSDIMWRWQYDEYYVEMEKDFEKYQNLDYEMEEVVSRHYRNGR